MTNYIKKIKINKNKKKKILKANLKLYCLKIHYL